MTCRMYYFLVLSIFVLPVRTLLLSKSKVQICENKGLSGNGDPQNLVNGKSCEKKMVVVMTVRNNQGETEKLHATVSRVRDSTSNEYARLYNPFMITISKSPVYINYPFFYVDQMVNNQPYEEIRKTKGAWYKADSSKTCYDQWQPEEKDELKPTCGYQYDTQKLRQSDGTFKTVKKRIFDSQGFCCHCSGEEKSATLGEEAVNFKRSGITCKLLTSDTQATGHCMKMDQLWYTVNQFTESYRDFTIHVKAFDQVQKVVRNKTIIDYVNGGEIILGPSMKSGIGKYQRIIAHYVGDFAPVQSFPTLTNNYFLIPKADPSLDANHPQLRDGVRKWLIMPRDLVSVDAKQCDMIGVSYSAFKNQASSGRGYGCQAKKGSCLRNQPYDKFYEDMDRLAKGKTPWYFPARYGKLAGVKKKDGDDEKFILTYELEEDHVSLVTLQISADDIILVYNRATGEIIRAAIKDFEALSMDGKLHVEVMNTGYVTSDFHISIPACSSGIHTVEERTVTIHPQVSAAVIFSLKTTSNDGKQYTCVVQLYDVKRKLLGQRNVTFSTSSPCTCEVQACKCECSEDGGVKCVEMEGKWKLHPDIFEPKKSSGGLLGNIGGFFEDLLSFRLFGNLFAGLFGDTIGKIVQLALVGVVAVVGVCLCVNCGGLTMCKKCCKKMMPLRKKKKKSPSKSDSGSSIEEFNVKKSKKDKSSAKKTKQGGKKEKKKEKPSVSKKTKKLNTEKSNDDPSSSSKPNKRSKNPHPSSRSERANDKPGGKSRSPSPSKKTKSNVKESAKRERSQSPGKRDKSGVSPTR